MALELLPRPTKSLLISDSMSNEFGACGELSPPPTMDCLEKTNFASDNRVSEKAKPADNNMRTSDSKGVPSLPPRRGGKVYPSSSALLATRNTSRHYLHSRSCPADGSSGVPLAQTAGGEEDLSMFSRNLSLDAIEIQEYHRQRTKLATSHTRADSESLASTIPPTFWEIQKAEQAKAKAQKSKKSQPSRSHKKSASSDLQIQTDILRLEPVEESPSGDSPSKVPAIAESEDKQESVHTAVESEDEQVRVSCFRRGKPRK